MTPMCLSIPEDYQESKPGLSACCHAEIVSDRRYRATATSPEEWDERCSECGCWSPDSEEEEK